MRKRDKAKRAIKLWWLDEQDVLEEHDTTNRDPNVKKGWGWRSQGSGPA